MEWNALQLPAPPPCLTRPLLLQEAAQWRERAAQCAAAFADRLAEAPIALPQMACGLHLLTLGHPRQVRRRLGCMPRGRRLLMCPNAARQLLMRSTNRCLRAPLHCRW